MSHYLVTGGCGFIGSHLADALCAHGDRVRILDDLSTGNMANKPARAELVVGDVADPATVRAAMRGVDACFHLAAVASVERSHAEWVRAHRTNVTGTVAVFDAARRDPVAPIPVVFASSAAVYGDNPQIPLAEEAALHPLSAYAADKLGSELHAAVAGNVHGIPNCGLRFFNVYGPRQDPNSPYSGVISIFAARLRAGRAITLHGDGRQTRDFVYVGDVVRALLAAMETCAVPGDVINVCTGRPTSIRELADAMGRRFGRRPEIALGPPRSGDIRHSVGDPRKAGRVLGYRPATDLRAGLAQTIGETAKRTDIRARHTVAAISPR